MTCSQAPPTLLDSDACARAVRTFPHSDWYVCVPPLRLQRRWSPDQMDALRAAALARLHALAPLCPEVRRPEGKSMRCVSP